MMCLRNIYAPLISPLHPSAASLVCRSEADKPAMRLDLGVSNGITIFGSSLLLPVALLFLSHRKKKEKKETSRMCTNAPANTLAKLGKVGVFFAL